MLFSATQAKSVRDLARLSLQVGGAAGRQVHTCCLQDWPAERPTAEGRACVLTRCTVCSQLLLEPAARVTRCSQQAWGPVIQQEPGAVHSSHLCVHQHQPCLSHATRQDCAPPHQQLCSPPTPHPRPPQDPEYLSVHAEAATPTPLKLQQAYMVVGLHEKMDVLWSFIKSHLKAKVIIFLSTCKQVRARQGRRGCRSCGCGCWPRTSSPA